MKYILIGLAALFAFVQADITPEGPECMTDSDCSNLECCYKKHDFLVVSKKRQTFEGFPVDPVDLAHTKGVCQQYHKLGDSCSPFDKTNGFCSCNEKQGHTCQMTVTKRAVFPFGRSYTCSPMLTVSK